MKTHVYKLDNDIKVGDYGESLMNLFSEFQKAQNEAEKAGSEEMDKLKTEKRGNSITKSVGSSRKNSFG